MSVTEDRRTSYHRQAINASGTLRRVLDTVSARILLAILFASGLGIRVYHCTDPLLEFHPVRQYRAAMQARALYLQDEEGTPPIVRELALLNYSRLETLEPPILETMAATIYEWLEGEHLWVGRVLSIAAWMVGAAALFAASSSLVGLTGAYVSVTLFLFNAFGIVASRSFQPDPLMVALTCVCLWLVVRATSRGGSLLPASVIGAAAMLVKPMALFFVLPCLMVGWWPAKGRTGTRKELMLLAAVTALPAALYYAYTVMLAHTIPSPFEHRVTPGLLTSWFFWHGWFERVRFVVGLEGVLAGIIGTALARPGSLSRRVLVALWIGYVVFCLTFPYHTATHDYYHLPLLIPISLAAAAAVTRGGEVIAQLSHPRRAHAFVAAVIIALVTIGAVRALPILQSNWARREVAVYERVGEIVSHDTRTVMLARDYGAALSYHGHLAGWPWPSKGDLSVNGALPSSSELPEWARAHVAAEARYRASYADNTPSYFVITDLDSLETQPDLQRFLRDRFRLVARGSGYVIYDLRDSQHPY